jgi:hypothetical protein
MDPVTALQRLGGVASYGELMGPTTRSALERAVREDRIVKPCRNRYALVDTDDQVRRAVALGGVLSHLSAALHHDWKVEFPPERMSITVPRSSRTPGADVEARWADLPDHDVHRHVTRRVRTVTDCARVYDFDVALSVADSALREGEVTRSELVTAAELSPRTGRAKALKVAELASGKRANPFESCLFAIAITVPGLAVSPRGSFRAWGGWTCSTSTWASSSRRSPSSSTARSTACAATSAATTDVRGGGSLSCASPGTR